MNAEKTQDVADFVSTREHEFSEFRSDMWHGRAVLLEASGGLTLDTARAVAQTGVHYISVGGLTHSSPILDIGLDVVTVG